jgi:hypothetical protein
VVTVEAVRGRTAWRRFVELPYALHRADPRWAPPVLAYERWRLDTARNPAYDDGEAAWWLVRVMGRITGRMLGWAPAAGGPGAFGFFDVTEDVDAALALVEEAAGWLRASGCSTMVGPLAFNGSDETGVLADGFDVPGTTGREWHPPWYHDRLEAAGMERLEERRTWRVDLTADDVPTTSSTLAPGGPSPPQAGRFADPALVLAGPDGEAVAAVPDVARRGEGGRSAWAAARQARHRRWSGCTVVRVTGDPARLVPGVCAAAASAGYQWTVVPWSPDDRPPETVHALYHLALR